MKERKGLSEWWKRLRRVVAVVAVVWCVGAPKAGAISFALDSIAEWGRFPRFCVNTYRWGDHFFNSYDSLYVQGSGKRWNVKAKTDSWLDNYNFRFDTGYKIDMFSRPVTTMGCYLTYMAVSVGYDMNISKYFNGAQSARKRFNLQFNCSLFAMEYYTVLNDMGTHISRLGYPGNMERTDIEFHGINTSSWGLDLYYFFNHKHYSQAAAFYYSKIQVRSSGSFFAGLSFWGQQFSFDFNELRDVIVSSDFPADWNYLYKVKNKNYGLKIGYAYNWVFHRGWCLGSSVAPIMGLRKGYINDPSAERNTFGLSNQARLSLVYNYRKRWFFGVVGRWDVGLIYDKQHTLISGNLSCEASAGFRFDLWK